MCLIINMDPMEALEHFYCGEINGVWEGELIKFEKEWGMHLPLLLKQFYQSYGYFDVNYGHKQLFLPDDIMILPNEGDSLAEMIIIGRCQDQYVGILNTGGIADNPKLYFGVRIQGETEALGQWDFQESALTLRDFLRFMFIENLSQHTHSEVVEDPSQLETVLVDDMQIHDEVFEAMQSQGSMICWCEEEAQFLNILFYSDNPVLVKFSQGMRLEELEQVFQQVFYQNSIHCDYAHALRLLETMMHKIEQEALDQRKLRNYQTLAGRCCWALHRWEEAETWYQKAEVRLKDEVAELIDQSQSFYFALGNFYYEKGEAEKSNLAYEKSKKSQLEGAENPRRTGDVLMQQAKQFGAKAQWALAITTCTQALETYQKDPKGCKYEIARCQQLRGEYRRYEKEEKKQLNDGEEVQKKGKKNKSPML